LVGAAGVSSWGAGRNHFLSAGRPSPSNPSSRTEFRRDLDPAARAAFRQTAPIAFKNVQQAVTTHSLTTEWAAV